MQFYGEIIDRMVTNRRIRDGWLNDRRLSARAPFEISTNIFLVAKAFSCFFLFFFFAVSLELDMIIFYAENF